ncbi:sugar phosphate nucleotidyltransferase [Dictyoglomus sp.]|jgi:mannose-1-phosphate guanylyltransferase/phosphomannomutase|uniref:sugar phosphate nucleotidyltransferase n=1 Tax=Dictyoglomus sp. TaxID=28205 RepID=UPI003D1131A4
MRAVIMAGGEGTRLRPLTITRPKPMTYVVGKPIMEHIINLLSEQGFRELTATLYYLPEIIQEYFADGSNWNVNLDYSIEESPLGTAGSVKYALKNKPKERILIISGDALTDFNLNEAIKFHEEKEALVTVVLTSVENPLEYGVVIINEDGRIIKFLEKPSWGEVFSDNVNTGIYILEPEVLDYIPENQPFDFSKDLFPMLLEKGAPIYGYLAQGYWCDIGNLEQFLQANFDVLNKKVKIKIPGREILPGIYTNEDVEIDPSAFIRPPVYIGQFTKINNNVTVLGPTIIGDSVYIDNEAKLQRCVVFNNTYIGKKVTIFSSIIGSKCNIKTATKIEEGVTIGDNTTIGERVFINSGVKIWPNKTVETGTIVNTSIIWGSQWRKSLFGYRGISGKINIDITPEIATKIGAAFGTILPKNSFVVMSRDEKPACRMIKRAILTGILSTGVNVFDIRTLPIPVSRYSIENLHAIAGVHIRISPYNSEKILIEFLDKKGTNIDKNTERKIENIFFREDFRRTYTEDIGVIRFPPHIIEYYVEGLLNRVDISLIRKKDFKIVIDYQGNSSSLFLPNVFSRLGIENISLNLYGEETKRFLVPEEEVLKITQSIGADFGIIINNDSEGFSLITNEGKIIAKDDLISLMTYLILKRDPKSQIVIPVTVSKAVEKVAEILGGSIIRSKTSPSELTKTILRSEARFGASEDGFIFPEFQLSFDGIFALIKFLELFSMVNITITEIVNTVPKYYKVSGTVDCFWENKGKIMRKLIEKFAEKQIDYIDGIKIYFDHSWVLILPHPEDSSFIVYAESSTLKEAQDLLEEFTNIIKELNSILN